MSRPSVVNIIRYSAALLAALSTRYGLAGDDLGSSALASAASSYSTYVSTLVIKYSLFLVVPLNVEVLDTAYRFLATDIVDDRIVWFRSLPIQYS